MRRLLGLVAVSCLLSVVGGWTPASASSQQIEINAGHGWEHDLSSPLFSIGSIIPGWQQSRSFQVRNDGDSASTIDLSSSGIVERENGCVHGEAVVDTTCGPDQGELGRKLVFHVYTDPSDTSTFGTDPIWTGTLYGLEHPLTLDANLPAHASFGVEIVADLPFATGDEVETDQVGFNLRLGLAQNGSPGTGVLGKKIHRGGSTGINLPGSSVNGLSSDLPFTGIYGAAIGAAGACLLMAGALLVVLGRRRRKALAL
jgi:hypothetical protein